jgi:hypothetical protein
VFTICTTKSNIHNSTFCPHSVFMCFVWISEQTAIISLYNINWLVCITETECVYCAVRTEYLATIRIKFSLARVMAHVVKSLRPNSKTRVWSQFSPSEICGGQSSKGTGFSPCTSFSLYQNYSINTPHSSSSTRCSYQKDKRAKPEKLAKKQCSFGNLWELDIKVHTDTLFWVLKGLIKNPKRIWSKISKLKSWNCILWVEVNCD